MPSGKASLSNVLEGVMVRADRDSDIGGVISRRTLLAGAAAAAGGLAISWRAAAAGTDLDVAYINARLWSGNGSVPAMSAVGTIDERIAAVGAGAVRGATGKRTRVVDLQGAFLMPGMTDCHTHFVLGSLRLSQIALETATTPEAFKAAIAERARATPRGEWLQGGGWDADRWNGELPTAAWIDAMTPDTPVAVQRYDLHLVLLNSLAMKLVGMDRNSPDVPGGVILRDAQGNPTGIFKDTAKDLVFSRIPQPSAAQIDAAMRHGIELGLSKGVTQVHCTEIDWATFEAMRRMHTGGVPAMRFYVFNPLADREKTVALVKAEGKGDHWFRWGASKVVFDGSLGSRTALFYDPYLDEPSTRGIVVTRREDLRAWMGEADKAGLQVSAHAIGDEGNDIVLDVMAEVVKANGARDRRFRIEHAQSLSTAAIPRFAEQGVIASVQPYHAVDDGRWAVRRIGPERLAHSFAYGSLVRSGAHLCMGSDWPVAPLDPMTGIKAAVLRETLDGKNPGGWYPEQRVPLTAALAGYTSEAAYAGFTETLTGRIAPGFLADLVVLDRDIFMIDPETLGEVKVLRTITGGEQRFEAA
jgi:predicted amidohydrolase YtcJ